MRQELLGKRQPYTFHVMFLHQQRKQLVSLFSLPFEFFSRYSIVVLVTPQLSILKTVANIL